MAHRLLIGAALAEGCSTVGPLEPSEDIRATCAALARLGARIRPTASGAEVCGVAGHPRKAAAPVFCGESASTLRLLLPLFALAPGRTVFTGAGRLLARPMGVYQSLFESRGLAFHIGGDAIEADGPLPPGHFQVPGHVSSQFISGLLLALPLLDAPSTIEILPPFESRGYVELTRAAQRLFGVESHWRENTLLVPGRQHYRPGRFAVEGDWSQGSVLLLLSALGGAVAVSGLPQATAQPDAAILPILRACGCTESWSGGLLRLHPPAGPLRSPGEVSLAQCPDLGPLLAVLGLFTAAPLTLTGAARLRSKESDRLAAMEAELTRLGAEVHPSPGGIRIARGRFPLPGRAACSHGDHRVAMALAAAAVGAGVELAIEGAEAVAKSWPSFFHTLQQLGLPVALA